MERYFDNGATTPIDPRVVAEMQPYIEEAFGNPHSIHAWGLRAREAVEVARERVASLIGAEDPSQIVFTSGATESNNWVISQFKDGAYSPYEHSSVREPAKRAGWEPMPNKGATLLPPAEKKEILSIMKVNNELGTIFEPAQFKPYANKIHTDITQAIGKLKTTMDGYDYASFTAHKMYGPKGVGALYMKDGDLEPLIVGGGQESGFRGGTVNVHGIVGFGMAAHIAEQELDKDCQHACCLRELVLDELHGFSEYRVNGGENVSPHVLSVSFHGLIAEAIVIEMDRKGFAVSSGSACSSKSDKPSPMLAAFELEDDWRQGTVRISFGRTNTLDSTRTLARALKEAVENLRKMA